jgi:hypothetical protein
LGLGGCRKRNKNSPQGDKVLGLSFIPSKKIPKMEFFGYCTGGWWVTQTKPCKAQNDKPMKFDLGGGGNIKSSNQTPTSKPWRWMVNWSGNNFLFSFNSWANNGGWLGCYCYYLPTNNPTSGMLVGSKNSFYLCINHLLT